VAGGLVKADGDDNTQAPMCNLYSMTKSRAQVLAATRAMRDRTANQPPLPAIFPDQLAPVVRCGEDGAREVLNMRWGFPPPTGAARPVTNIRNLKSSYWRAWMAPAQRCLVPVTSFCEYTDASPKLAHWFALAEDRPLFAFAGLWRPWRGVRGKQDSEHLLFAFLTTEPNDLIAPIHAKAMPVMLASAADLDAWLEAPTEQALALAKPFPAERMRLVLSGPRQDEAT
jgi:putative SOS response-associated peptidase YedK